MEKDRQEEALQVLHKLHGDGTSETERLIELEFREIRDVIEADRIHGQTSWTNIITKASWRKRLILGCGVQAFGPLSGINVINVSQERRLIRQRPILMYGCSTMVHRSTRSWASKNRHRS